MAEQFGQLATQALRIVAGVETASPAPSTGSMTLFSPVETMAWLVGLPARLDDTQLATVRELARAALPPMPPVSPRQFADALRKLSILPRRADDDMTGEERVKVYARMLGSYPAEAIGYMVRTALETCDWFPTPRQCLAIIEKWERRDDAVMARTRARNKLIAENEDRWNELQERFRRAACGEIEIDQAEIDALPDHIKRALDNAMLLRPTEEGWKLRPQRKAEMSWMSEERAA